MDNSEIITSDSTNTMTDHIGMFEPQNCLNGETSSMNIFSNNSDENQGYFDNSDMNFPVDENGNGEVSFDFQQFSSPKRRKVDSDGFVTPSTPDIPHRSQYFMPHDKVSDIQNEAPPNSDVQDGMSLPQFSQDHGDNDNTEGMLDGDQLVSQFESDPERSRTVPSRPEATSSVLTHHGVAMKELLSQWSDTFRERETFEMNTVQHLDSLLATAHQLEQTLIQQKDDLRQRLMRISQALSICTE